MRQRFEDRPLQLAYPVDCANVLLTLLVQAMLGRKDVYSSSRAGLYTRLQSWIQ